MLPTHVFLGAVAGVTIFLGLPVARWRGVSNRTSGLLALAAAGVVVFLLIEVGFQAMQRVEVAALGGGGAPMSGAILVVGFTLGLVGLAWLEDHRRRKRKEGAGPVEVATMVAVGIGVHNLAEGLAIGQSFAGGASELGTVLVVGFGLHNATEGFGIAGPLAGEGVSWPRLLSLGLIGGAPTALGAFVGGLWVSAALELLFLSLAAGSLVYVSRELLRIRFAEVTATSGMFALTVGLFLGFATELVVDVGQAGGSGTVEAAAASVAYAGMEVDPASVTLTRGDGLEIRNDSEQALIFEGNGLYPGEVAVSPGSSVTVTTSGPPGEYRLVDERGLSGTGTIILEPGGEVDPLLSEKNALGALTILEGHVRAAWDLHRRALEGESSHPGADLARAGAHAGHPQGELLHGSQPDALALQELLREHELLRSVDAALSDFVRRSGNPEVSTDRLEDVYERVLITVEEARRAIGGAEYDRPPFRSDVIRFVLETAAGEYATAAEGAEIAVRSPGMAGQDDFIEYQDARAFVAAAREILEPLRPGMTIGASRAFTSLDGNVFRTLDPAVPHAPLPPALVRSLTDMVLQGLPEGA